MDSVSDHKLDENTFDILWENISEQEKEDLINEAAGMNPAVAILPVLKGLLSYHFSIRNSSRRTLNAIQQAIAVLLTDAHDAKSRRAALKVSECVCSKVYAQISDQMALTDISFLIRMLLLTEGRGAAYAFKALYLDKISSSVIEKVLLSLPESVRLGFVEVFVLQAPEVRLMFGRLVQRLLLSIEKKKSVIYFLAGIFDLGRQADSLLLNLDPELIDPQTIIRMDVSSLSADMRVRGLKALSLIVSKIPEDLLSGILETDTHQPVRMTVYQIIENSQLGAYKELFNPIIEVMGRIEAQEQYPAARAMLVSGKLPLYTVFEIIRDNYPALIPLFCADISRMERLAFLVIQDIALNKDKYLDQNRDIADAAVFGMIKKRPERVVRVLKQFDDDPDDKIRLTVTRFIEKTKNLLEKEKENIESGHSDVLQFVNENSKKSSGFIKAIFSSTADKKLEILRQNKDSLPLDFEGQTLKDADFSATAYRTSAIYFNESIINNCDFSNASFIKAFFQKTVLYNVDMHNTRFDAACFDNAVLINVNARGAVFENCSFQNTRMYNCNFNETILRDTPFVGATISKCSFSLADLSHSSLAYARISAVSFVYTTIEQTSFAGLKARFCRFPYRMHANLANLDIDYNARKFQLLPEDMPQLKKRVMAEVNRLVFTQFIQFGETKFFRQNQASLLTAYDIFKPRQAHLFQIIPYLLHENLAFPGIEENIDPVTPCGVFEYLPNQETKRILKQYMKAKDIVSKRNLEPAVEGLFTIGSTGSLAQTAESDIDYWVCIDEKKFSKKQFSLFKHKLELLEMFAQKHFQTQVTFFVVDMVKAKNNDFGGSTVESSGSAQTRLLKEEFYRTMIWVAGKLPLWAVLPTTVSINYYSAILTDISGPRDSARYLDFGDIHAISTSEYFGASIWQMFKWLKSPFKSVIKMSLLEKFIHEYGKKPLLCNLYKDEWMNSGVSLSLASNDSYYILLKHLLEYYEDMADNESIELLLTCFFLKLGISGESQVENTVFGLRRILLEKCLDKWNWSRERVYEIGNFKNWLYTDIARLSTVIETYMVKKYKTVNKAFDTLIQENSLISPEDRTALSRKVFVEFSKPPGKVEKVLLVSRSDRHFTGLHLKYVKKTGKAGTWELVNRSSKTIENREEPIIEARTIEEIGAWLINNGLYNEQMIINLVPNPTYVTFDDIKKLFRALSDFLRPAMHQVVGFDQLLRRSRVIYLFISINFYAPRKQQKVTEYTAIYLNSWGEMFCKSVYARQGFASMETVKQDIMTRIGLRKLPLNTAYYFSKGAVRG